MSHDIDVLGFARAPAPDQARGLLGWISARYGDLVLDGIALRRSADGRLILAWPGRRDKHGHLHHSVRPVNDAARVVLEAAVFEQLSLGAEVRP